MGYPATMRAKSCLWPHSSAEFAHHVPIILGTPTTDQAIVTLKESEIDRLATPWGLCEEEYIALSSNNLGHSG